MENTHIVHYSLTNWASWTLSIPLSETSIVMLGGYNGNGCCRDVWILDTGKTQPLYIVLCIFLIEQHHKTTNLRNC